MQRPADHAAQFVQSGFCLPPAAERLVGLILRREQQAQVIPADQNELRGADRQRVLISVLGDRGGERDRLGANPFATDSRGFGFSLPKQDEESDDRAKRARKVRFAFAGIPNSLQLVAGKNARAARLSERSDGDDRVVG